MAGADVVARAVYRQTLDTALGDLSVVVGLASATMEFLVLSFPERTAAALAGRMLAGVTEKLDEGLIRDCVGEIANVVCGQAKAMLAGTLHQFVFSMPKVVAGANESQPRQDLDCLVVVFSSDRGEFTMRVFLKS